MNSTRSLVSDIRQGRFTNCVSAVFRGWYVAVFQIIILCHFNTVSYGGGLKITLANENVPPQITGQTPDPLSKQEDEIFAIELSNLIVSDPDDTYPDGFTLQISGGDHYTVSGNVITPEKDYSGDLLIGVTVNDGEANSNTYLFKVKLGAINDPPSITGQTPNPISATEDSPFDVSLSQLIVSDPDNSYPGGFTMEVLPGTNYSASGLTLTPSQNFTGMLTVNVRVSDGTSWSDAFGLAVQVNPVNDAPSITGQIPDPWTSPEDTPINVSLNNLLVTDPDDVYPTDFTLSLQAGPNYTVNGSTVTPANNYSGPLSIPAVVNDGDANSNTYNISVTVSNSNDVPVITGQQTLTVDEDNSLQISLGNLTVSDPDGNYPNGYTLTLRDGDNYSISGATVIPDPNFSGLLSVPVSVNDGFDESNLFSLQVTVNAVNDPPVITGQNTVSTEENQPKTLSLNDLVVTDPDNAYPTGFTLVVAEGENYSVNGTTITPANGFSGELTVGVKVFDGADNSNDFALKVSVAPVNDPPVIVSQRELTTAEDNGITILLTDLTVTDPDNTYPIGFTIKLSPGPNYTVSGTTVSPAKDFTGTLSVPTVVNDGTNDSQPFNLLIAVTPSNDSPVIAGQQPLSVNEDAPITLVLENLVVIDPDNAYPAGFTLIVGSGANYTVSGSTIVPSKDFNGVVTVPVQVSDGNSTSNVFPLQITVVPVNDAPIIIGQQPLTTAEDTPIIVLLTHLLVTDPDNVYPAGYTMQLAAGDNYTVSGNIVTPSANYSGTLNIPVTVNDGVTTSEVFTLQIQVGDANDPPTITGQLPLSVNEEAALSISLSDLTVTDPDNNYPDGFTLLLAPGENYTLSGNIVTPTANFSGTLTIPTRVNDGINNSPTFDLKVQVLPVNDAPYFDPIADETITENSPAKDVRITNISKGPNESDQTVTVTATSSNALIVPNPTVTFDGVSTAVLSVAPAANVSGSVTITVTVTDNGSAEAPNQNSFSRTFQVKVEEINAAPTLDPILDQTVQEDAGQMAISLTGISAGPGESQNISIDVSSDKPELFETLAVQYTSPESTGRLDIKPALNANGAAKVTVRVTDNGSATPPSINNFSRSFMFTIQPVNDPPVFVSKPVTLAIVKEPYEYIVEVVDAEGASLAIKGISIPSWATLSPTNNGKARLAGTPPEGASGTTTVILQVDDSGIVVQQQFDLVVNTRPVVTSFTISLQEDSAYHFNGTEFSTAYSDVNQQPISKILITMIPANGKLFAGQAEVRPNDTIDFTVIGSVVYKPNQDYYGSDAIGWKARDAYSYSANDARISIQIQPVNDPPTFVLETDSLHYEVNGEPRAITELFHVLDPDDDSVSQAEVGFRPLNFHLDVDILTFGNSPNIKASYDYVNGRISLSGKAPIGEYDQLIRGIMYNHLNTLDPILEHKSVYFKLNDGKAWGDANERVIEMQYTFIELEIPSGFTPNGDGANDTWVITRPGGLDKLERAVIRIFNRRGDEVFRREGFDAMWDGTMNGHSLPADTYFYTIDLNLRNRKTYKGVVTILR